MTPTHGPTLPFGPTASFGPNGNGQMVERPPSGSLGLYRLYCCAGVSVPAILSAVLVAFAVLQWAPLTDPIDVIGVPLLTGYSEAAEHTAFFTFTGCVVIFAACLRRLARRWPVAVNHYHGALSLPLLWFIPLWNYAPAGLPAATLIGVTAFFIAQRRPYRQSNRRSALVLAATFLIWIAGFPELPIALAANWSSVALAIALVAAMEWFWRLWMPHTSVRPVWWVISLLAVIVVAGTFAAPSRRLALAFSGGLAFWLGCRSRNYRVALQHVVPNRQSAAVECDRVRDTGDLNWLYCSVMLGVVLRTHDHWSVLGSVTPALSVAGGAAGAALLGNVIAPLRRASPFFMPIVRHSGSLRILGVAMAILPVVLIKPWFVMVVGLTAVGALALTLPVRCRGLSGVLMAACCLLALLPARPNPVVDDFHDGQILSAVWEFESGRRLFDEVFPLRGFEFAVSAVFRHVLPPTFLAHQFAQNLLAHLPVAAVCLATFAWTRMAHWSFATAMLAATFGYTSARSGVALAFAALAFDALRHPGARRWLSLCGGGWLAAFCGYDVFVPYLAAATAAALVGETRPRSPTFARRCRCSALVVAGIIAPFCALLAAWQGASAVVVYWRLLFDNARNLPAFYGLPLPWNVVEHRVAIAAALAVLGMCGAAGIARWRQLGRSTRAAGIFLFVQTSLTFVRAVGRSDAAHLHALEFPSLLLGSLLLFGGLRMIRRGGHRCVWTDSRTLAAIVLAAGVWCTPHGSSSPRDLMVWWRLACKPQETLLVPSSDLLAKVAPEEYLWEVDGGILNYVHERHNPTRHALAYCISSPAEQRDAVAALRRNPPRAIAWRHMSRTDGIANPIRFYVMSQFVFRSYRPDVPTGLLEPSPPGWSGWDNLPPQFQGELQLGLLPIRWAQDRSADLERRRLDESHIFEWHATGATELGAGPPGAPFAAQWESNDLELPATFNYLSLEFAIDRQTGNDGDDCQIVVRFAPARHEYAADDRFSFRGAGDAAQHIYVLPVGCSPGWSWRRQIDRLRIESTGPYRLSRPKARCWRIDELRE